MNQYNESSPRKQSQAQQFNQIVARDVVPPLREVIMQTAQQLAAERYTAPDVFDVDAEAGYIIRALVGYLFQCEVEPGDPGILHPCQLGDEYVRAWFEVETGA